MATVADALTLAVQCHQAGNLPEAERIYRQVLLAEPANAQALHLLGLLAHQVGRHDLALCHMRQALDLRPHDAFFHSNLGLVYQALGRLDDAVASHREALRLRPDFPEGQNNLGMALKARGRPVEAEACYRAALRLRPDFPEAHNNLGNALQEQGRRDEAEGCYREALRRRPDYAEPCCNLSSVCLEQGRVEEAEAYLRAALRLKPGLAEVHYNLGLAVQGQGRPAEAEACFREALRLQPGYPEAHNNLGAVLQAQGRLAEAERCYRAALCVAPGNAEARHNLGHALRDQGRLDEAIVSYRQAVACKPDDPRMHSGLLLPLAHVPHDPAALLREHLRWAERHAAPLTAGAPPHGNDRTPDRPLRVGYVSPDLRAHPVATFLEPVLAAHDRSRFHVTCYADVARPDAETRRLRDLADGWRSLVRLADDQVARWIREDGIDVLVDLAGHTAHNRLLAFARRPAPVQVTHFGCPTTTGMSAMDYRITDTHADPPGRTERYYTEELVRLPEVAWCYLPSPSPEVGRLPARAAGHVTFGSLNSLAKVTPGALALWARLLKQGPGSRLLLLTDAGMDAGPRLREVFAGHGIDGGRLRLVGRQTRDRYLALHQEVDVALDPFPYNGGVTTCDALWMGVPVVTLEGETYVARQGVSLLSNLGLPEWIARDPDEYLAIAVRAAQDLPALASLRGSLRERVRASPLADGERFTRHLEAAYRRLWQRWCGRPG